MILIKTKTKESEFTVNGEESNKIFDIKKERGAVFNKSIKYELKVQKTVKDIIIKGSASTTITYTCSRCLKDFNVFVELKDLLFSYVIEEVGDFVDMTPVIREEFLLQIPIRPLCSPDCKGLCPNCGKDLNEGSCSCKTKNKISPFDILDNFKLD